MQIHRPLSGKGLARIRRESNVPNFISLVAGSGHRGGLDNLSLGASANLESRHAAELRVRNSAKWGPLLKSSVDFRSKHQRGSRVSATTAYPAFTSKVTMAEPQHTVVTETTSEPLKLPPEQQSLFREILELFEEQKVPFVVAGAFALQAHTGICRDTKDLDLFLTSENAMTALTMLREKGFKCEVCDPVWLFKAHREGFFVDLITGMSNATIVVEDSWIKRSKAATVHGVPTRVLAAEELICSKLFVTRRERFDGADIAHVIYGTKGKLDWQRIFELTGDHWEVLLWSLILFRYVYPAQTNYVPAEIWRDLLRRFSDAVAHPDPHARFRGSLIDDKMFAIDLNEWGLDNIMQEYRQRRLQTLPESAKQE